MTISPTAKIYPGVVLGESVKIEDFCIVGAPFEGMNKNTKTIIGEGAHIRSHTVIYAGNLIGKNFKTGNKTNIREKNIIGNDVSIGTLSVIEHNVEIGDRVRIHSQVFIPEFSKLEEGVWIGPNVVFTNALYPKSKGVKERLKGPDIKQDAIVGANTTILPSIIVGERCIIGAGSVVTKDLKPGKVYVGNPAKEINRVENLPYSENVRCD